MTTEGNSEMDLHIPPPRREWNINTLISVFGFLAMLAGGVFGYAQLTAQVGYTAEQFAAYKTATDIRMAAIEVANRQIDNLQFRLSAVENVNTQVTRGLDDLKTAVSNQSGDLRVMKEILQRLEQQVSPSRSIVATQP